jgi:pyruvate/2-oxoglutarate dehydrogenase complex dihydrolipoamide dehydrogenase (E3) component
MYAQLNIDQFMALGIPYLLNATVLDITESKCVTICDPTGIFEIQAEVIVLAMGARERTRGNIAIAGNRCVGVWTAGNAQKYLNMDGYLVGKRIFILGSGDIGLIMARRLTLAKAVVVGVAEIMPYSNGLNRNIVQCLHDFDIPLYLSTTITKIKGDGRVEAITLCRVDENRQPLIETGFDVEVDTVLLSVGLIPDNVLSEKAKVDLDPKTKGPLVNSQLMTKIPGIFACGNVLHIHDLVDHVSMEGMLVANSIMTYLNHETKAKIIPVQAKGALSYILPQTLSSESKSVLLKYRVNKPMKKGVLKLISNDQVIMSFPKIDLHPSEMQTCQLSQALLSKIDYNLVVELCDE